MGHAHLCAGVLAHTNKFRKIMFTVLATTMSLDIFQNPSLNGLDLGAVFTTIIHPSDTSVRVRSLSFAHSSSANVIYGCKLDNHALDKYVIEIIGRIDALAPRKRKRNVRFKRQLHTALKQVLIALYKARTRQNNAPVVIHLNSNLYTKQPSRYRKHWPSYTCLKAIYDGLKVLSLIDVRLGNYVRSEEAAVYFDGHATRIKATATLIDELSALSINLDAVQYSIDQEAIILRKTTKLPTTGKSRNARKIKENIDYRDTPEIERMRHKLLRVNEALAKNYIDIELTDDEFKRIQIRERSDGNDYQGTIDLSQKYLHRVFTKRESARDFTLGGRFYGPWWQTIGSEYRRFIKINGRRTVELDYVCFHPTLIYAEAGLPLSDDPYDIGLDAKYRDAVKLAFNAIINADSKRKPNGYDETVIGIKWSEMRELIEAKHLSIKDRYFYSGYGLKLQYLDSRMTEYILLGLLQENVICLPVHDSYLVSFQHQDALIKMMIEAVNKFVEMEIGIKVIEGKENRVVEDELINEHKGDDIYEGYKDRFRNWLSN